MKLWLSFFVALLAVYSTKSEVDVDRLFHSNSPITSAPQVNRPPSPQLQPQQQNNKNDGIVGDVFDEFDQDTFVPYRNSRHDEFDWALTKNVLNSKRENTILSPFLVKVLLSILAEAAGPDTSTHRELLSVLPSIQTIAETRELYAKAFGSLLKDSTAYELNLGAKLYVDKFVEPRQRFASVIEEFYYSKVESIDFSRSQEAANIINTWCASATKNHINNIVSPDDVAHSVILLINTIYFNGFWRRPFPENQTTIANFHTDAKSVIQVPFMVNTADYHYLESKELDAKILRLPYKGYKFAMYIVLPSQKDGLNELISKIDSSTLHRAQYLLEEVEVKVSMPKYKFTNSIQLNEVLKNLGIRQMFTNQASLPQMARGKYVQDRLQVSNVLQKTGIEINEKGSTVFAATQISLVNKFGGDYEFTADRPFLFMIEDETTGTLIFSGKVLRPE